MRPTRVAPLVLAVSVAVGMAPAAVAAPHPPESDPDAVVRTDNGLVRGVVHDGYRLFQGIPYATPPVGDLRWRPPRPADPWPGVYDATFPRSQCAQLAPAYGGETTYVEDCLYLNVTTPTPDHPGKAKGRRGLPVMVWIHGGGNTTGRGHVYDASKLATEGDVVVVTLNYRLGPLGWLAHPALESDDRRRYQAGNYGLLDQQAALRWVRRNVAAFGGDPGNVTIFGESAGSADSCAHIASPTAAGLFHKAIPQSGSCASPTRTEAGAQAEAEAFAEVVGCAAAGTPEQTAACLREVPVETLLERSEAEGLNAGPVAGGDHVLPLQPREAVERGRFNRVPVLHGNTRDEMRLFVSLAFPEPISESRYEAIVRGTYGAAADEVLARYPVEDYPEPRIALAAIQTDFGSGLSTCQHLAAYRMFERAGVPVYAYQFADRNAPPLVDVPGFDEGAEHATELTYLFPGLLGELNAEQRRLSDDMVGYWTSFAHKGKPKAHRAPHWPKFHSAGDVLTLAPGRGGIRATDIAEQSNCAFWASLEPEG